MLLWFVYKCELILPWTKLFSLSWWLFIILIIHGCLNGLKCDKFLLCYVQRIICLNVCMRNWRVLLHCWINLFCSIIFNQKILSKLLVSKSSLWYVNHKLRFEYFPLELVWGHIIISSERLLPIYIEWLKVSSLYLVIRSSPLSNRCW